MDYTGVFTYNNENLLHIPDNMVIAGIVIAVAIVVIFFIKTLWLWWVGFLLLREDEKKITNRKKTLSDLILMKDIQTELEKEIEQATLQAAFQN